MKDTHTRKERRRIAWAFFILAFSLFLSSCGWDKGEKTDSVEPTQEMSSEQIEKQAWERARVNKLETLTPENLAVQVAEANGKKILKNQNLFINYLKAEEVDTAAELMAWLNRLEIFSKQNGLEISPSDIMVIISGVRTNDPSGKICKSLGENLSGNTYYQYMRKSCSPPPPPAKR